MEDEILCDYENTLQDKMNESIVQIDFDLLKEIKKYAPGASIEEIVNEYALPIWIELQRMNLAEKRSQEIKKIKEDDGPYKIEKWGDHWIVVDGQDPNRKPATGRRYTHDTHAYRAARRLNKATADMERIMRENGGALIL